MNDDIRQKVDDGLKLGVEMGWWEGVDWKIREPIPFPKVFKLADFPTMAHVMFEAGIFKSVSEARRNGWNRPTEIGDWILTKKRIRVRVEK